MSLPTDLADVPRWGPLKQEKPGRKFGLDASDVEERGAGTTDQEHTTYHIYHTGKATLNLSIHTIPDKYIQLPQFDDPNTSNYADPTLKPKRWARKKIGPKKSCIVDHPGLDPRTETSPYFVHQPRLTFHHPPRTLRRGGNKTASPICLIHSSAFWRTWKLEFGEGLANEGIIDGRGVVARPGAKESNGRAPKGYPIRNWRLAGETGKAFHKQQKALRESVADDRKIAETNGMGKLKDGTLPPQSMREKYEEPIIDEVVHLKWSFPQPRRFHFAYQGHDFYWKGTVAAKTHKFLGLWLALNHLKLVVAVTGSTAGTKTEICLARFTSVVSKRKYGRLIIFDTTMENFLAEHIFKQEVIVPLSSVRMGDSTPAPPSLSSTVVDDTAHIGGDDVVARDAEVEKMRTRFRDLVMATAICMIIGEFQWRRVIQEILMAIAQDAGGGG